MTRGEAFRRPWHAEPDCQIQVLSSLFFRNKGAYIVGRVINGTRITPIASPRFTMCPRAKSRP